MPRLIRLLALGTTFFCVALPGVRSQPDGNSSFPLPETYFPALKGILSAAVSQSPRMVARNAENAVAEGNQIVMRSGQLPSVGGYVQFFPWQRDDRADLPAPTNTKRLNYSLTLTQPIYHWGALQNNTRIGELQLRMTQGQTFEGYRLLVQEIRGQYLQLVVKKAIREKSQLGLRMAQDNFAVAQTKLEKKVNSEADMFQPRVGLEQAKLNADRSSEDYENLKAVFAKLCGAPVLSDAEIPDSFPDPSDSHPAFEPMLAAFTSQKDPNSYSLRYLGDQIEVERLSYENVTTRLRPKLNFLMGVSQDQTSYTTNISAKYRLTSLFAGVSLNWSIFDGFATRGAAASSLARRRMLEQSYQDLAVNLADQARSQLKQVGFARRGMEIANMLLNSSASALREKKNDAGRGLASEADVNTYDLSRQEAQIYAYNTRADYLMKSGDYLSTLLEDPALANLPAHP